MRLGVGAATACFDDIELARAIVVVGANPTEAHPVVGARIRRRCARGTRLIVIDPRRTELAERGDLFLQLRPRRATSRCSTRWPGRSCWRAAKSTAATSRSGAAASRSSSAAARRGRRRGPPARRGVRWRRWAPPPACWAPARRSSSRPGPVGAHPGHGVGARAVQPGAAHGQHRAAGRRDCFRCAGRTTSRATRTWARARPLHRLSGARRRRRCGRASAPLWGALPPGGPGSAVTGMIDARRARRAARALGPGRGPRAERPRPAPRRARPRPPRPAGRPGPLPQRDRPDSRTSCCPRRAGSSRTAPSPTPSGASSACAPPLRPPGEARPDWEVIRDLARRSGRDWGYPTPDVSGRDRRGGARLFGGVLVRAALERRPAVALSGPGAPRHAAPARGRLRAPAARRSRRVDFAAEPGERRDRLPVPAGHWPRPAPLQRREHDPAHADLRSLAPGDVLEIHPDDAAREGVGDGQRVTVESPWGSATVTRADDRAVPAGVLFLSFHQPETHTNRLVGPHDPVSGCPHYKLTAVRLRVSG